MSKGFTALGDCDTLASIPPNAPMSACLLSQVLPTFSSPTLCVCLSKSSLCITEFSLPRGRPQHLGTLLPRPAASFLQQSLPGKPYTHLSFVLGCLADQNAGSLVPTLHPTHIHTDCLKFYYLFPLPRAWLSGGGREIDPALTSSSTLLAP